LRADCNKKRETKKGFWFWSLTNNISKQQQQQQESKRTCHTLVEG
jgi:hypothetical protein